MPVFPSREWMETFGAGLAAHPDAAVVAGVLDGVYRFVVLPAGPLTAEHTYDLDIRPTDRGAAVAVIDDTGEAPRLTLTAGYDRWKQLVRGEMDIPMALMLRRLRISGDIGRVTKHPEVAKPLFAALGGVPTTWLD